MNLHSKTITKLRQLINEETEYRSGPVLVSFFNGLGFNDSYGQGFPSRWSYTEDRLNAINGTDKIKECILQLFSPINFIGKYDILDKHINDFNQYLSFDNLIITRTNKTIDIIPFDGGSEVVENNLSEDEFINKEIKDISIDELGLDQPITDVLKQRIDEIRKCLNSKSSLAVIFLCGSTLEGILLGIACLYPKYFNQSPSSPKDETGKVRQFQDWALSNFIDVAHSLRLLGEDVKKFSHSLRDFRNYIHPYQQMSSGFNPDEHTAKICWQVMQAAIAQISANKKNL